jgi:UDP-N-acetylglucosamine acyltransferase
MHRLRRAYRLLFFTEGRLAERLEALAGEFADDPLVGKIVAFARAGAKRPLMRPRVRRGAEASDDSEDAQEQR